jgi:hypothetical protein
MQQDNNANALRMYSLMKKIVGSSTDDYYTSVKEVPEFHKASTYTSTSTENNVTNDQNNQQTQNNNNDFLKHYELMKMIASCGSPFEP